jgi:hypothetical protein
MTVTTSTSTSHEDAAHWAPLLNATDECSPQMIKLSQHVMRESLKLKHVSSSSMTTSTTRTRVKSSSSSPSSTSSASSFQHPQPAVKVSTNKFVSLKDANLIHDKNENSVSFSKKLRLLKLFLSVYAPFFNNANSLMKKVNQLEADYHSIHQDSTTTTSSSSSSSDPDSDQRRITSDVVYSNSSSSSSRALLVATKTNDINQVKLDMLLLTTEMFDTLKHIMTKEMKGFNNVDKLGVLFDKRLRYASSSFFTNVYASSQFCHSFQTASIEKIKKLKEKEEEEEDNSVHEVDNVPSDIGNDNHQIHQNNKKIKSVSKYETVSRTKVSLIQNTANTAVCFVGSTRTLHRQDVQDSLLYRFYAGWGLENMWTFAVLSAEESEDKESYVEFMSKLKYDDNNTYICV